jgi:protein-L-isoaspartate(D-aspartate) O-methyltransferase
MTVNDTTVSQALRQRLVASLREHDAISSDAIAQAFLAIPRERFVPFFYEQEGFLWVKRSPEYFIDEVQWLEAIYRDIPLVTLLDERNWPISSNSMPTVIAWMLEALDVHPGHRVLEIGTGSGYNAALLSHLVGDPTLVTTIDLEEALTQAAEKALRETLGAVTVLTGDGRRGVGERAPYDRIIATASASEIPPLWYEQLAPEGRLVLALQGSLKKGGFLVIDRQADGTALGRFDPRPLHFMPLRPGDDLQARPAAQLLQEPVTGEVTIPAQEAEKMLFENDAFQWFLQWYDPGITLAKSQMTQGEHKGEKAVTIIDGQKQTMLRFRLFQDQWMGRQRGGANLWESITNAYAQWNYLGQPLVNAYAVTRDEQGNFRLVVQQNSANISFVLDSFGTSGT